MKYLLILLLLIQSTISFSQKGKMDSIEVAYKAAKEDTAKIDVLLSAYSYLRDSKPDKAIAYGNAALKLAQAIKDKRRESLLLDLIGQGYEAIGNIADAFSNYNASHKIANELQDAKLLAKAKLNLGACYNDIGNFHLAVEYYTDAIKYFIALNDSNYMCESEVFLSDALFKNNAPDDALAYLNKAVLISSRLGGYMSDYIYTNFAECYYRKKQYKLAEENALKGIAAAKTSNDLYALSGAYTALAKAYMAMNGLAKAELNAQKGFEIAKQTSITENLMDSYNLFSEILKKQKRFEEALQYKTKYILTKDSIESGVNDNILRAYETEKKNEQLAIVKNEELQKDAQLKQQHYIIAVIFALLLLLVCVSGYVLYSRNKLEKANLAIEAAYEEVEKNRKEILLQNEELKQSNERILKQSEHIEELNTLKDRLFSIISHDLRSPLNNLKGIMGLLAGGNLSQERFQTIVPKLVSGVSAMSDLVENLLNWSVVQLKGVLINIIDFDVATIAQNQLNLVEKQATDKDITLKNEIVKDTLVRADKNMIELVLRNLVANAIKFCYLGGQIVVSSKVFDDNIEISVSDTGVGISPENIQRMFQIKERFTTVGTNNEVGTGLGLLLCRDFVEKNNGSIGVESKVNEGSRFWFTLPKGNRE